MSKQPKPGKAPNTIKPSKPPKAPKTKRSLSQQVPIAQFWRLAAKYMRPQMGSVAMLAGLLLFTVAIQLTNPQILGAFIDTATGKGPLQRLILLAGIYISAAIINQGVSIGSTYVSQRLSWTSTNTMRIELTQHCLGLDMSFHKVHTPGQMIERIDGDINQLSNFFAQFLHVLISNIILLLGILVLLFRIDWRVGLAMAGFVVLAAVLLDRIRSWAIPRWGRVRQASSEFYGFLGEHLSNTEDTRANGATVYLMKRFYQHLQNWWPLTRVASMAGFSMWITSLITLAIGNAVAFGLSAWLWRHGAITLGTAYMIFNYTNLLSQPIENIRTQMEDLQRAEASIRRVQGLFATPSRIPNEGTQQLPAGALPLEFDQVTFGYEADHTVLDCIDIRVAPGRVLGVLGHTGSGKTTLSRLLLRLYDVTSGSVRIGDIDVRDVSLASLRNRVAIVTQDVQLFHASVRDNLTFFDSSITDSQIKQVLWQLGLLDWIDSLPDGLDNELHGGSGLSAGESQLLAFARVFLRDPGLVILDEASSRLDPATEAFIDRAVSHLLTNRTGIIIAHRLATLSRVDDILILDGGRVIEYGPRVDLEANPNSKFYQLLQTDMMGVMA